MLNIGIIGNTEVLEPHVKRIQKNKNVNVIGKTSVGTSAQLNGFHFSIPEFNRVELIERAELFLVDSSSLLPFEMLCEIVKKSKHIFATENLKLTAEECVRLLKLANESGSVVQVTNPYFYTAEIQWLNKNLSSPLFLNISKYSENESLRKILFPLLLMISEITPSFPKKVGTSAFNSSQNESAFVNVRLEYGDMSVVNINFGSQIPEGRFIIDGYSKGQLVNFDVQKKSFLFNKKNIDLLEYSSVNEFDVFIDFTQNRSRKNGNLEAFVDACKLVEIVEEKVTQFIAS